MPKLVNFMAPAARGDDGFAAADELFASLFGGAASIAVEPGTAAAAAGAGAGPKAGSATVAAKPAASASAKKPAPVKRSEVVIEEYP